MSILGLGAFAGGAATGYAAGTRLNIEEDEAKQRKQERDLRMQQEGLALDQAQQQARDSAERRNLYDSLTTEPYQTTDASDNVVEGRRPISLDDGAKRNVWSRMAEYDASRGKVSPDQALQFQSHLRTADQEGVWDALSKLDAGDIEGGKKAFHAKGNYKIVGDPVSEERTDPTGMKYTAWKAHLVDDKGNETMGELDPYKLSIAQGGAAGFAKRQETMLHARKAQLDSAKEDRRYEEGVRRDEQRDKALDISSRRADSADRRATAAEERANRPGNDGGVFGFKMRMLEHAAPHLSEMDRYKLASGQKNIPSAQIAKWAEDTVARQEKLTGIPMKPDDRRKKVQEAVQYYKGFADSDAPGGPGNAAPGLSAPAAPSSGVVPGRNDYRSLWGG